MVQKGVLALDEFELVGCPQSLADWLAGRLNRGEQIGLRPGRANGKPVYRLRVQSAQARFLLYLTRPGELPTGLAIAGPGMLGISEVKLGRNPNGRASRKPSVNVPEAVPCAPHQRHLPARSPTCA